jgi:hypothetical protein
MIDSLVTHSIFDCCTLHDWYTSVLGLRTQYPARQNLNHECWLANVQNLKKAMHVTNFAANR